MKGDFDQSAFGGETPYYIMFGPDICGNERKTHFIINYNDTNNLSNKKLKVESDNVTHEYTAVIKPDNTYIVYIDGTETSSGSIE